MKQHLDKNLNLYVHVLVIQDFWYRNIYILGI